MIYITGDMHGDTNRFRKEYLRNEDQWTADDVLIVCGDFGFIFTGSQQEEEFLDVLSKKPYTICFCDGNHENFSRIYTYPKESWNGGYVHKIRHNVLHLMRGQVFTINGKRIFTMGGAYSIDKYVRTEGTSWWSQELPSDSEYKEGISSLKEHNYKVDYIVTHTAPRYVIRMMGKFPDMHDMELTGFLEWVMHEVEFKRWFFGHWHYDKSIDQRFRAAWFDLIPIYDEISE